MSDSYFEDDLSQFYARRSSVTNYGTNSDNAAQTQSDGGGMAAAKEGGIAEVDVDDVGISAQECAADFSLDDSVEDVKIVRGFLFTASRQGNGEFWPLHVGTNTIGRLMTCDICLPEENVANRHAELNLEQGEGGLAVSLCVFQDEYATQLNGLTLDAGVVKCHDRDIIAIGDNLQFLLLLADVEKYGLNVSDKMADKALAADEPIIAVEENKQEPTFAEDFDSEATRLV